MELEIYELSPLFEAVQLNQVFADGKTFVDCVPKAPTADILYRYLRQKRDPGFNLKDFVLDNFELPGTFATPFKTDSNKTAAEHIQQLWPMLTRQPDEKKGSLIPLPHPYVVPGGRFGEVYYWDSYFTMLGLRQSGMHDMIENMVNNFSHLIRSLGYIPNGNRSYFLGRSQPPFFSLMVQLLAEIKGDSIWSLFLNSMEKEYQYWMLGATHLMNNTSASLHTVKMQDGEILNRYWDEHDNPRPESYREDVELTHLSRQAPSNLFRHLRAGAESGWDYSSRWFENEDDFGTIETTSIIPVDLNSLLFVMEQNLAKAYSTSGDNEKCRLYESLAEQRKQAVHKYCWHQRDGFYMDYVWDEKKQKQSLTLAAVVPLFCKLASREQADKIALVLEQKFLKPGGLVTSLKVTGQQWDAPNGWAPLQWMAVAGLKNYGQDKLARNIAGRWLALNDKVYHSTGKMMEKYNVEDLSKEAGGGEYLSQDGFGWTNGVYLALREHA
jgi:alpha,alpha-trehalase